MADGPHSSTEMSARVLESNHSSGGERYPGEATHILSAAQDDNVWWQLVKFLCCTVHNCTRCCSSYQEIEQQEAFLIPKHGRRYCLQTARSWISCLPRSGKLPFPACTLRFWGSDEPVSRHWWRCLSENLGRECWRNDKHMLLFLPCGPRKGFTRPIVHMRDNTIILDTVSPHGIKSCLSPLQSTLHF